MIRSRQMTEALLSLSYARDKRLFFYISPSDVNVPYEPCNFPDLTSLIVAFIVFPKYIPDLYVFLISVRIEFFPSPPSVVPLYLPFNLPRDRFPAGRIRRMGTSPTKLDIRNFVWLSPESRGRDLILFVLYPPIDFTSLLDLFTSREYLV